MKLYTNNESLKVGILLAFLGGIINAYTYLWRGGVLATVITGNIVLMGIHFSNGNLLTVLHYLFPILAFGFGIFFVEISKYKFINKVADYHQKIIFLEMIIMLIVLMLPTGATNWFTNIIVAFMSAVQIESFRTIQGFPAFTTMCTGNLRSAMEALSKYVLHKDSTSFQQMKVYVSIILSFFIGVLACGIVSSYLNQYVLTLSFLPLIIIYTLLNKKATK